jgi:hypothetical protein
MGDFIRYLRNPCQEFYLSEAKSPNPRQTLMLSRFEGCFQRFIYTPRPIAQTLYFSLRCVDGLQREGLRCVFKAIFGKICYGFDRCVDLAPETLTE